MITDKEYSRFVASIKKPGDAIADVLTGRDADAIHMIMGICGEAGELLDSIKKHVIYRQPIDMINIVEEMGDIEFYLEGLRQWAKVSRDVVITTNVAKLEKRYSQGIYSDSQATERADKE